MTKFEQHYSENINIFDNISVWIVYPKADLLYDNSGSVFFFVSIAFG